MSEQVLTTVVRRAGGSFRLALAGELDLHGVDQLAARVVEALTAEGVDRVEVDLSDLHFIDSSGIQALLRAQAQVRKAQVGFRVVEISRAVERVMKLAGLGDTLLPADPGS